MHAIKFGTEVRQYVRIQVVGKDRVGKTSLVRRLLFLEKGEYGGKSTDGIDISRKCQIRNSDGDWIVGEVDRKRKIIERIQRALNKQRRTEEPVSDMSPPLPPKENNSLQNSRNMPKNQSKEKSFETKTLETNEGAQTLNNEVQYTKSTYDPVAALYANSDENKLYMRATKEKPENNDFNLRKETSVSIAVPAENLNDVISEKDDLTAKMIVEKMNDIIWEAKTEKEKNTSEALIECGIWDFAGQRDYYASHQTFFTPHAIYLLVADISEDIKDINYDGNVDYNSIGNYIEFWFDSIHCLCKDLSEDELCPPIIMVCTGTDKVEKDKDWKRMYNEKVSTIISKQKRADHRRGIYFISNTHFLEEDIEEIKRLRAHISEIAKKMKYFAETVPTRWIQLENVLGVLKGVNKNNVCSFKTIQQLADRMSVEEEELLLFLDYQHKIGNIIFFNEIREYIILQPEWLVKCFRCLVCDSNADKRDFNVICPTAFEKLTTTGELPDKLVDQLFQKEPDLNFKAYKAHLLNVMEKFDIVIKPTFRDTSNKACHISNSYYLPCMIEKPSPYTSIRNAFIQNNADVAITPWLVFEFEFLPLAYFNHILFHYIRHFEVCIESIDKSEKKAIYSGKAVFFLDEFRKFIICFSHNAISLQIWEWGGVNEDTHDIYENVLNTLRNAIESIRENLSHDIPYTIKAKCRTGDYFNKAGRKSLMELPMKNIYMCEEHQQTHPKKEIEHVWLKHDVKILKLPEKEGEAKEQGENKRQKGDEERNKNVKILKLPEKDGEASKLAEEQQQKRDEEWNKNDMYEKKPGQNGLVLIVNFPFRDHRENRLGSEIDVQNLTHFFKEELNYQVECTTHDMTRLGLQNYLKKFATTYLEENSKDYHSFICVLMSHGNMDGISTTDKYITIEEIKQIFKNHPGGQFSG
ncbi:probable serine/threonine-protein kinase roco6 [Mytilus edulis]|uniref:probable serine/threonine-protein kinase roco6 n=1 Tax=Mytilus edulis TaxID=6550 RepID=UPI0039EF2F6A